MNHKRLFTWGTRTFIMGIVNITPDSFSGDGLLSHSDPIEAALAQALRFVEAGVDILDIGGESTRPGSVAPSAAEEMERIIPVIKSLAGKTDAVLSVDTYKAEVARAALDAGADWINDIWALRADPDMARVAVQTGAPVVLMHNRSKASEVILSKNLGGQYRGSDYSNLIADVKTELMEAVQTARMAGVHEDRIILDPGLGFGKTVEQNLELINRLDEIKALGFPILVGPSRKSFIGYTLNLPVERRLEGTEAAVVISILRGADIVRVHDVEPITALVKMTDAILKAGGSKPASASHE
jgi:dihydropteroate synthase